MGGPIDLKFSGGILGSTDILASGLVEMCRIHFKFFSASWNGKNEWRDSGMIRTPSAVVIADN